MRLPKHTSPALALSIAAALLGVTAMAAATPVLLGPRGDDRPDRHELPTRDHPAPRDGHDIGALGLLVGTRTDDGVAPAKGAHVLVEHHVPKGPPADNTTAAPPNGTWETVLEGTVGERGTFATALPTGGYRVTVSDGNATAERHLRLHEDTWLRVVLGADKPHTMGR